MLGGWVDYGQAAYLRGRQVLGLDPETAREHDKVEDFEAQVKQAKDEEKEDCFRDLKDLDFSKVEVIHGRNVWLIHGARLPMAVLDRERVWRFMLLGWELGEPTIVLYVHTGASYHENCPGLTWMSEKLKSIPQVHKEKIQKVLILHPDLHLWLCMQVLGSSMLQVLWSKTVFLMRVEYLWDTFEKGSIQLPPSVKEHDEYLEQNPLSDFYINGSSLIHTVQPQE